MICKERKTASLVFLLAHALSVCAVWECVCYAELPSSYGEHKEARREPDNASAQPELKQSALPLTPHASAAEVSFDCISQAFADHHSSASAGFGTAEAVALPSEDMHTSGQQQDGTRIDQLEHAVHALRSRIEQVEASEVESSEAIVEVQSRLQQLNMQYNDSLASIEERLQYVEAASLSTPSEAEDLREELHEVRNTARSTLERLKAIEDGLAATDQRVRAVSGEAHQLADRMHLHEKSRGDSVPTHSLSGGEGDELHALQQRVQMIQPKPSDHIAKDSINSTADEILQRLEWFDQAGDPPKAPQLSDAETHELRTLRQQLQSPYSATATAAQCVNHSVAPVSPSQKHDPSSVHGNPHQHNHADTRDAANSGMRVSSETYADWKQSVIDQKAQPASSPHHASINHHRGAHGVNENSGNAADSDEEHLYTWRQGALGTSISEVQNRKFRRLAHDEKLQQSLEDVENLLQRLLLRISSATESSSSSVRLDEIRSIRASLEELARYLRERCLKSEVQKPVQR